MNAVNILKFQAKNIQLTLVAYITALGIFFHYEKNSRRGFP
ncbi:MAG: hypothetical protein PHY59_04210 [Methanobacterium sp.]|nr:hypothetical protein [Methanobacterium sp.]